MAEWLRECLYKDICVKKWGNDYPSLFSDKKCQSDLNKECYEEELYNGWMRKLSMPVYVMLKGCYRSVEAGIFLRWYNKERNKVNA